MMNRADQVYTALQAIEDITMQLGSLIAPLDELTSEAEIQIQQAIEAIRRQTLLIQEQVEPAVSRGFPERKI